MERFEKRPSLCFGPRATSLSPPFCPPLSIHRTADGITHQSHLSLSKDLAPLLPPSFHPPHSGRHQSHLSLSKEKSSWLFELLDGGWTVS